MEAILKLDIWNVFLARFFSLFPILIPESLESIPDILLRGVK